MGSSEVLYVGLIIGFVAILGLGLLVFFMMSDRKKSVGITIVIILMLLVIGFFVYLAITDQTPYNFLLKHGLAWY